MSTVVKNKSLIFFLILFFVLQFISCFKKPKWDTNITIPLISKLFTITSLIDTNNFVINNDSSINFYKTGKLDTIFPLDSIRIQDNNDSTYTTLTDFIFNNLVSSRVGLDANEITRLPFPIPDTSIRIPIPPFHRDTTKTVILNNIENISIIRAVLHIAVTNGTRLTFDSINCCLTNSEPIRIHLPAVDSLSTVEVSQILENIDIDSILSFQVFLASHGTGGESILISNHDSIKFNITFDSLRIHSGRFHAVSPRTIRSSKERIYFLSSNYQIQVRDIMCHSGLLSVELNNQFPVSTNLQVTIPELSLDTILFLPAFNITNFLIDLANRHYHNTSQLLTPLTLRTAAEFPLDTNMIELGPQNSIGVIYNLTSLQIDSIAGTILDTIEQTIAGDSVSIDIPDFLNRTQTVHAYATIDITNAVAFPIDLQLNVVAKNTTGDSAVIDTIFSIIPGSPNNPQITSITLDFNNLLNVHPNLAIINSKISSSGDGWMSRASYNTASYTIMSPLRVVLKADTVSFGPDTVRIGEDIRNKIRDNLKSGLFFTDVQNHLPSVLSGKIILQNSSFDSVPISIAVPSAIIDNNGVVTTPVDTNITISLTEPDIQIFTDSILKVTIRLYIPNTDTITITGRDYVKLVNSYAKIETELPPK
jgi:hypothetical protein